MKNIIKFIFLFILFSISSNLYSQCVGNCTSVTATLTDTSTQVWSNATVTINIVPPFGNPAPLLNNGIPVASPNNVVTTNNLGTFTISLDDNAKLTPAGSRWNFTMCPNATTVNCSTGQIFVTGTTQNLSASLSSYLTVPLVNAGPTLQRAYSDSEANGGTGSVYWNTISNIFKGCSIGPCPVNSWTTLGNLGVPGAIYDVPFNAGNGAFNASSLFSWNSSTNTLFENINTSGIDNGVYNASSCGYSIPPSWCSGTDIGGWINSAIIALGCGTIFIPSGTYNFSTGINLPMCVILEGAGIDSTNLVWTGTTSGTAITINVPANVAGGIRDLNLTCVGSCTTTIGVQVGLLSGGSGGVSVGTTFQHIQIYGWNKGIQFGNYAWLWTCDDCIINNNVYGIYVPSAPNTSGENMTITKSKFLTNSSYGIYQSTGGDYPPGWELNIDHTSFDFNGVAIMGGFGSAFNHFEQATGYLFDLTNGGGVQDFKSEFRMDNTGTVSCLGNLLNSSTFPNAFVGSEFSSANTVTNLFCNNALLTLISPHADGGVTLPSPNYYSNGIMLPELYQTSSNSFAGTTTCAGGTKSILFGATYNSTPTIVVSDETTAGGAKVTSKNSSGFTVACSGSTDAFDWISIAEPD